MQELQEQIKNEIEKYAEIISVTVEDAQAIFDSVASDNNLDVNTEDGLKIARSVFRSKFGQARNRKEGDSDPKSDDSGNDWEAKVTGFFYGVEQSRDWQQNRRDTLLAEYQRDATQCLESGTIALAVQLSDGRFEVNKMKDNEMITAVLEKLPDCNPMQVDDERWIIPIDNRKAFQSGQENKEYGNPLPTEDWSRNLFLIADIGGIVGSYQLRLKGEQAKDFSPTTFTACEFTCVNSGKGILYGRKDGSTLTSLKYLDDDVKYLDLIQEHLEDKVSALTSLDVYHSDNSHKPFAEKIVITDGNVSNMNLQVTSNGTKRIHLSDLNADFDYDGEGYSSVTCWVPEYIDIDFGIGSNVVITGRTSQGQTSEGELRDVSINVLGIHVVDKHGTVEIPNQPVEEFTDWF
jgi:hypothetical protein